MIRDFLKEENRDVFYLREVCRFHGEVGGSYSYASGVFRHLVSEGLFVGVSGGSDRCSYFTFSNKGRRVVGLLGELKKTLNS